MAITDKRDHERMTIECETKGCPAKSLYCSAAAWNRRAPAAPAEPPAPEAPKMVRCIHAISGACFHYIQVCCLPHAKDSACLADYPCPYSPTGRARCVEVGA